MDNHITYYCNHNNIVFKAQNKTLGMRLEIQIQEIDKDSEPNWEAMGVDKPKSKRNYKFRRCLIHVGDLEYIKEYTKEQSILKCIWMEESVVVAGGYDDLVIKVNDLENSFYEGEDE